jgi:CubicO group peptidase (beta-lactamase class C family)
MKRIYLFIFICHLFALHSSAQIALNQKIDAIYQTPSSVKQPGLSLGIWKDGKVLFAQNYGLANLEHQVPFSSQTISDMGSVAKQLTCFGILLLAEQGKLSLEDDIRAHLTYVPDFGSVIRIRHLMHHTSGLREVYSTEAIRGGRPGDAIFQEDVRQLVAQQMALNFEPGSEFSYCNTAYAMLADIIEKVGGMPFEEWMQSNIFQPLEMNNSYIMDVQGEVFPNMADSYYRQNNGSYTKAFDNSTIRGQGGLYSSLDDMMKWLANLAQHRLGGPAIHQQMVKTGIFNNGDTSNYASGLFVAPDRGLKRIFHTGSSAGYRTLLTYFPEYDLGFVFKTNSPSVSIYETAELIIQHFLGAELPETIIPANPTPSPETPSINPSLSSKELDKITGIYFSPELETIYKLYLKGGKLMGKHFRHGNFMLQYEGNDQFRSDKGFFPKMVLSKDKKGQIIGLKLSTSQARNVWFEKFN